MNIKRLETGPRMSHSVVNWGFVIISGQRRK
jgi:hypothetical protein